MPVPERAYRSGQREAIDEIVRHFAAGARVVYLSAPVGAGKSLINLEVARLIGGAYISTPQVGLVAQYERDTDPGGKFAGLGTTLVGRVNYPCPFLNEKGDENATAEGAPCTYRFKCPVRDEGECPYYNDRAVAIEGPTSIGTLAYLFTGIRFRLGSIWPKRPLLVLDEAHGLLGGVVEHFAIRVGPDTLPDLDFDALSEAKDPLEFLRGELPSQVAKYAARLQAAFDRLEGSAPTESQARRMKESKTHMDRANRMLQSLSVAGISWVYRWEEERRTHTWRPIDVAPFLGSFWDSFPSILLASGTFVDPDRLHRDLGLPRPAKVVEVADSFPSKSAPIVLVGSIKLSKSRTPGELPNLVEEIARIAEIHSDERGVVHAHSYALVSSIKSNASPGLKVRFVSHDRESRNDAYAAWIRHGRPRSIFLAVGMYEGIDLLHDLARFQILVKCPYPNLGDPWIRTRQSRSGGARWYEDEALTAILQTAGRVMRAADDRGTTYILDRHAVDLIRRRRADLPEWFRGRLVEGRIPDPGSSGPGPKVGRDGGEAGPSLAPVSPMCRACDGTGHRAKRPQLPCRYCNGTGQRS